MSLTDLLTKKIKEKGPISVSEYMEEALTNEEHGYYIKNDPIGAKGDYITAPEVSQIFGELIGAWCLDTWQKMGSPKDCVLVELGPGRGTMMKDIIRSSKNIKEFHNAISVCLVEASPSMRKIQRQTLKEEQEGLDIKWYNDIEKLPKKPMILVANEFFDALPIKQYIMRKGGFRENLVSIDANDKFSFVTSSVLEKELPKKRIGTVLEVSPASHQIMEQITKRIESNGGAGLIIDYGYKTTVGGNTLQSVKGHDFANVLETPGEADITAHVDFKSLRQTVAKNKNISVYPIISQSKFLNNICLRTRLKYLLRNCKNEKQAMELKSAVERLTSHEQMGKLFKVMGICDKNIKKLSGF